jgi:hypothetical protein
MESASPVSENPFRPCPATAGFFRSGFRGKPSGRIIRNIVSRAAGTGLGWGRDRTAPDRANGAKLSPADPDTSFADSGDGRTHRSSDTRRGFTAEPRNLRKKTANFSGRGRTLAGLTARVPLPGQNHRIPGKSSTFCLLPRRGSLVSSLPHPVGELKEHHCVLFLSPDASQGKMAAHS